MRLEAPWYRVLHFLVLTRLARDDWKARFSINDKLVVRNQLEKDEVPIYRWHKFFSNYFYKHEPRSGIFYLLLKLTKVYIVSLDNALHNETIQKQFG